ncbi:hypothetical protein LAZ67_14002117 [Cordylochernes scorpioides]|uniref:DUF5641 domain-containing protein n=1 Tax=Cordylochernes scorpioides TaxID=51811 RepID=A0ABY6L6N9_9ARAC|nr:hypothetical protein LAZ67_14002117 [Cordylochernes scorpioides]
MSLNDCSETGPNLLEHIPNILIRFRENKIEISADIRKAFQMIEVNPEDRKYLKFIWRNIGGSVLTFRHTQSYYCGGIVYVGNDIQKRINWPLGLVKKVYLGEDRNYRVAKSRIKSGEIVRPIQRLYPLEIHFSDMEAHGVQNLSEDPSNLNIKNEQQKRNRRSGKNYIDD